MDERDTAGVPWREIVAILLRRRMLILAVFAGGVVSALVLTFMQGPTYHTAAKLMISSNRARITVSPDPREGATVERVTEQDLASEVALLQSPSLVREVLEPYQNQNAQLPKPTGLAHDAAMIATSVLQLPSRIYRRIHGIAPPSMLDYWVEGTLKQLNVTPIGGSNLIMVAYDGPEPKWAAEFVNKLVTHHVELQVRLNQQADALGFFESQRQLLAERVSKAQAALASFYDRENIDAGNDQRSVLRTRLGKLRASLADADTKSAEAQARADFLKQALSAQPKNLPPGRKTVQNDPLQLLRTRVLELDLQRSEALSKFAPTSIKIQEIDRQIAEARRLLAEQEKLNGPDNGATNPTHQKLDLDLTQTEAEMAALKARAKALRAQVATDQQTLEHLDTVASEQDRLEQELASAKESLLTYSKKQEEARFADALDQSRILNVTVVEQARIPTAPQPSKRQVIMLLGSAMSLFVGLGVAFVRDRMDPTVKSAAEATSVSGFEVLADIPS